MIEDDLTPVSFGGTLKSFQLHFELPLDINIVFDWKELHDKILTGAQAMNALNNGYKVRSGNIIVRTHSIFGYIDNEGNRIFTQNILRHNDWIIETGNDI